ncbi:MAG TPA: ATP-binding protein [Crinalium sp.]
MEGQFQGYIGSVLDISERKRVEDERQQAEAALREGENRLRLALASAALGTWDFDPITGVLQWDKQCKAMFGLSPTAEINYTIFLAGLHPEDRDRADQVVQLALKPESGGEYDLEYRTIGIEDGVERWIAAKGKAFFNPVGIAVRFIGTVLNITEKKQAEAEREQLLQRSQAAREAAETANRIKDEFLAVLSHELRSPLNPILGWSKLLQQRKLDAAKTTMALAAIERNAQLQAQLIDDLLDISRILRGKLSLTVMPVDLSTVIGAALETVQLAAEAKAIQIQTMIAPDVGVVMGDAGRLQQVVWNLLSNAVKFTLTKGQVTVALSSTGSHAQIQVSDTGKGIKPEFLPYVFEHFRQEDGATTRKFGGLGLGLAIVRQIVELHGGTVAAESGGEQQGATFVVQLPTLPQATPVLSESTHAQREAVRRLNNVQILLVEDDTDTREFQAFLLEQYGARVTAVASGLAALQALEQLLPDVIVSDIGMPDMDGYRLMQQIRSRPPSQGGTVPALALTAYAAESDQKRALQAGFQQHLTKPVEPERLVSALLHLLQPN